jgi:hypothetical protein
MVLNFNQMQRSYCASAGSEKTNLPSKIHARRSPSAATAKEYGCTETFSRLDQEVWKTRNRFIPPLSALNSSNLPIQPPIGEAKLPIAYVFLNTDIGPEADVLASLRKVEGVLEAHRLLGVYGIIARVKADSVDGLKSIVSQKLHINRVHSRLTVVVTET